VLDHVRLREARLSDCDSVSSLKARAGLGMDSRDNWLRLWKHNPAIRYCRSPWPMGWVLEAHEAIVGYLGSIPLLYAYGERVFLAATTCGLAIDPQYRVLCARLMAAFFQQENVDLFLDTTASETAGRIVTAFKAKRLPQKDYDKVLLWILDPDDFAEAYLQKIALRRELVGVSKLLLQVALRADIAVGRKWPRRHVGGLQVCQLEPSEVGAEFDWLWSQKTKERTRLFACRTAEVLRWHLSAPYKTHKDVVLQCRKNGEMYGYAIVTNSVVPGTRMLRSTLTDLVAHNDDSDVVECLLINAYEYAKALGSGVLEMFGFPGCVREVCFKARPYSRKFPAFPFYYKAANEALHESLSYEKSWYACPFDGDTSLWP